MSEVNKILELIEKVSPDDVAMLDEIDARATAYFLNQTYENHSNHVGYTDEDRCVYTRENGWIKRLELCRSRDALKSIRPDGYGFMNIGHNTKGESFCQLTIDGKDFHSPGMEAKDYGKFLPNEFLSELHAILQSIDHERSKGE